MAGFGIVSKWSDGGNTQDYWVLELCPLSGILKTHTKEHKVSKTGFVYVLL
jgi:hypothetical protein